MRGGSESDDGELDHDRRARLNQRLRQAFIEGAEADSRRRLGRGPDGRGAGAAAEFAEAVTRVEVGHEGSGFTGVIVGADDPPTLRRITRAISRVGHDEALAPGNVRIVADRAA